MLKVGEVETRAQVARLQLRDAGERPLQRGTVVGQERESGGKSLVLHRGAARLGHASQRLAGGGGVAEPQGAVGEAKPRLIALRSEPDGLAPALQREWRAGPLIEGGQRAAGGKVAGVDLHGLLQKHPRPLKVTG